MGDVLVENPSALKRPGTAAIPSIENFDGVATDGSDDYNALKKLQRQLEYIHLQEEYIKDEQR